MPTVPPSADFLTQHASILVFLAAIVGLMAFVLVLWKVLRPARLDPEKLTTYECGEEPVGIAWIQFNIRFYVFALIFIVFDVEAVFLLPWAVGLPRARGPRLRRGARLHRASWRWPSPTCGARATSSGCGPRTGPDGRHVGDQGPHPEPLRRRAGRSPASTRSSTGPQEQHLVHDVRPRLLRHRDDGGRRQPLRHGPLRHHAPRHAAPDRPHDRGRHRDPEDGDAPQAALRADARAQVRASRWAPAPTTAGPTGSTATTCSRASTRSSRWTSTCPAARRGPRRCSTAS